MLAAALCLLLTLIMAVPVSASTAPRSGESMADLRIVDLEGQPIEGVLIWSADTQLDFESDLVAEPSGGSPADVSVTSRIVAVDQRDKRFEPFVSWIEPGTSVEFPNSDDIRHHVYSFSAPNGFERKLYRANEAEPKMFQHVGVIALGCNIHDTMQAYIVVTGVPPLGMSDAEGHVKLDAVASGYRVWHPLLPAGQRSVVLSTHGDAASTVPTLTLPLVWRDPQAARDASELENLLKKFSTGVQ